MVKLFLFLFLIVVHSTYADEWDDSVVDGSDSGSSDDEHAIEKRSAASALAAALGRRGKHGLHLGGPKSFKKSFRHKRSAASALAAALGRRGPKGKLGFGGPKSFKKSFRAKRGSSIQKRAVAEFQKGSPKLWEDVVYFEFDPALSKEIQTKIDKVTHYLTQKTCLNFKAFDSSLPDTTDRITFTPTKETCESEYGRTGGKQVITINDDPSEGCTALPLLAHEIFHSLGLTHEMKRPDRAHWLKVFDNNIEDLDQFNKEKNLYGPGIFPFDVSSIMQYDKQFLKKGEDPTYDLKDHDLDYWARRSVKSYAKPSMMDIKTLNNLYKCTDKCGDKKCQNNGFAGGADCGCICPAGLGGDSCEERVNDDCGETLSGKSGTIKSPEFATDLFSTDSEDEICSWLIPAKDDQIVHLSFMDSFATDPSDDGFYNYIDIRRYGVDLAGARKWGPQDHSKMAYGIKGSGYVEMGIQGGNGFGVGFTASFQILSAADFDKCNKMVCYNGGTLNTGSCSCECRDGYTGKDCGEFENKDCATRLPCMNGGKLDLSSADCSCKCPKVPDDRNPIVGKKCQFIGHCHQKLQPVATLMALKIHPFKPDNAQCPAKCDGSLLTKVMCPEVCKAKCLCTDITNPAVSCAQMQTVLSMKMKAMSECKASPATLITVQCQKFCDLCPTDGGQDE